MFARSLANPPLGLSAGKLVGVIGDEDTVTGFLLAGVGHRTQEGANFLVVQPGKRSRNRACQGAYRVAMERVTEASPHARHTTVSGGDDVPDADRQG
jgi:hypothetical protein